MPAYDIELVVSQDLTVTADVDSDVVDCEGGFLAWACLQLGAMTGGTNLDVTVLVSPDAGANYYLAGKFQQLDGNDDSLFLRIPVYVMRPDSPTGYQPSPAVAKVKFHYNDTGSGTWVIDKAWISPMLSLAVPATDEELAEGAAIRLSSS